MVRLDLPAIAGATLAVAPPHRYSHFSSGSSASRFPVMISTASKNHQQHRPQQPVILVDTAHSATCFFEALL
jgi:hypothetical protein